MVESGFRHSAFTFATESSVERGGFDSSDVPSGALITLVQKGLQYQRIELHIDEAGVEMECEAPFSATRPHVCVRSEKMEISSGDQDISDVEVMKLEGHGSEVICLVAHNTYLPVLGVWLCVEPNEQPHPRDGLRG